MGKLLSISLLLGLHADNSRPGTYLEEQIRKDTVPVKAGSRFLAPNGELVGELQFLRRRRQDLVIAVLVVMIMVVVIMGISIHFIVRNRHPGVGSSRIRRIQNGI